MWNLKYISIYTLCSQEKNYVFSMWDNKLFWFKYFNLKIENSLVYIFYVHKKKVMFFQYEIWNILVYILYVHKKKTMCFQCRIINVFGLNTST
jgi:hypothetical protein